MASGSSALAGDPEDQFAWHESFRDQLKNMYRTSYSDMSHGREVAVSSDFPSGYGGHVPSVRHDVLFRNTVFDRELTTRRHHPDREAFPNYQDQISGIPTHTRFPQGAKKTPTYGTVPHNGTTTMLKPPWGVLAGKSDPLNHRTTPRTMTRPTVTALRVNQAAVNTGSFLANNDLMPAATPRSSTPRQALASTTTARGGVNEMLATARSQ